MTPAAILDTLLTEILRDTHRYTPGIDQRRAALGRDQSSVRERTLRAAREYARDLLEQGAARMGFSHRHFEPDRAAQRLARLIELAPRLQWTYEMLGDEGSRRAMIDVLKLRVLGPHHARLGITPEEFRAQQVKLDREHLVTPSTYEVSDPWFSPLSLYKIRGPGGSWINMHGHSVDLVSVFGLGQYAYHQGPRRVGAQRGDVVFDVGGCWGDTALYFADQVGPPGKVFTFEFDPESLQILRANLALNPELASRVEVVEKPLWDRSGEVLEYVSAGRCTTVLPSSSDGRAHIETVALDDFVQEVGLEQLDFLKVDVEGVELSVLRGAQESLRRFGPAMAFAAYHHDDDLIAIPDMLCATRPDWQFYLGSFSPVEEETVLFARLSPVSNST